MITLNSARNLLLPGLAYYEELNPGIELDLQVDPADESIAVTGYNRDTKAIDRRLALTKAERADAKQAARLFRERLSDCIRAVDGVNVPLASPD
jgi:hypothetical protein